VHPGPHGRFYSGQRVFVQDMQHRIQDVQGFRQDRLHVVLEHTAVAHANYDRDPRCGQRESSAGVWHWLQIVRCRHEGFRGERIAPARERSQSQSPGAGRSAGARCIGFQGRLQCNQPRHLFVGGGRAALVNEKPIHRCPRIALRRPVLGFARSAGGCYDLAPPGSIRAHPAEQAVRGEVHTRRGRAGRDPCELNRGCSRMVSREKAGHQVRELTDFQGIPEK
jgi:hypothetical protein